jgi:hypothetical protein
MNILPPISFPDITLPELPGFLWWGNTEPKPPDGLELGNGQTLTVEDVLEGHFYRLVNQSMTEQTSLSTEMPTETRTSRDLRKR